MSRDKILNTMRQQASINLNDASYARLGVVTSYDPNTHMVKVKLQPEDPNSPNQSLTGFIPLISPFVGNGWGLVASPSIGDMVIVIFQEGYVTNGYAVGGLWNKSIKPPAAPSGEFWLVHKSGSYLKFTNDGKVSINSHSDFNVTCGGKVNITSTSDIDITSNTVVNVTAPSINLGSSPPESLSSFKSLINSEILTWLSSHVHANVQSGGDMSGASPTPIPPSSTSVVKAE